MLQRKAFRQLVLAAMDSDGWRRRKRKPAASDSGQTVEARVLDTESGEKKHGKTFVRKRSDSASSGASAVAAKRVKVVDDRETKAVSECMRATCISE